MNQKSQISLFILIGIVAVIIIAVFITQSSEVAKMPETAAAPADVAPIRLFTEECFKRVAEDAVLAASYQGGRAFVYEDDLLLELPEFYTSYNYYEGNQTSATEDYAELLISTYVQEEIIPCLNSYASFAGQKVSPKLTMPSVNTTLSDSKVMIVMNYPLEISSQGRKTELADAYTEVLDVRLRHMMDIEKELALQTKNHPDLIDMSYLSSLDVNATAVTYGDDSVVYILRDEKSKIAGTYGIYYFAAKLGYPYKVSNSTLGIVYDSGKTFVNISARGELLQ